MPPEPKFEAADLRRFLTAVDAYLVESAAIIVIGGSAIALYGGRGGTTDIDTYESASGLARLAQAADRARAQTGLDIPIVGTPVADAPINYDERMQQEPGPWTRLVVWKLEPHDLALSKAVRGNEHDLAGIEELHRVASLDRETLVTRYVEEMGHAIGDPRGRDLNFASMIERLFGTPEAERVEERLAARRRSGR